MPTRQDYKLMLQKVLEVINKDDDGDFFICKEAEEVLKCAQELILKDRSTYDWVIEYDRSSERCCSEKNLLEFVRNCFDEDPDFVNQIERVYKVEVDEDGNEIRNEIDLSLSWSVTLDGPI